MKDKQLSVSRREFIATTSAALLAGSATGAKSTAAEPSAAPKLAMLGGEKAVKKMPPSVRRWGDLERERLNAMLEQDSLFYWKGPQTALALERYKKIYPFKYAHTCTS